MAIRLDEIKIVKKPNWKTRIDIKIPGLGYFIVHDIDDACDFIRDFFNTGKIVLTRENGFSKQCFEDDHYDSDETKEGCDDED